jgi:hypothetical protein
VVSVVVDPKLAALITFGVMAIVAVAYLVGGIIENRRDAALTSYANRRALRRARMNKLARRGTRVAR